MEESPASSTSRGLEGNTLGRLRPRLWPPYCWAPSPESQLTLGVGVGDALPSCAHRQRSHTTDSFKQDCVPVQVQGQANFGKHDVSMACQGLTTGVRVPLRRGLWAHCMLLSA